MFSSFFFVKGNFVFLNFVIENDSIWVRSYFCFFGWKEEVVLRDSFFFNILKDYLGEYNELGGCNIFSYYLWDVLN